MQVRSLISLTLLTAIFSTYATAEEVKKTALTAEQKAEVQSIVRELLRSDPGLIEASLIANHEKKEAAAREEAKKAVKSEHKAIYEDNEDPIIGNPKGTLTMVVFMDPYCGHCRKFQPVLHKAAKDHKDLKIIYKPLPIMGAESKKAIEEELAANDMGRFQDYHEAVYESSAHSRKERMQLAEKNNIDTKALQAGISSNKVDKHLERNVKLAGKLGIRGTPAFIIDDELIPGAVGQEELYEMIKGAQTKK